MRTINNEWKSLPYLTEGALGAFLKEIYPNNTFIHNRKIKDCPENFRPDYHCPELGIAVEFDGYQHYTLAKNILKDQHKDIIYRKLGYKIIRIPYYIQLSDDIIYKLFNVKIQIKDQVLRSIQSYPQGFVSDNVILPSDFCFNGVKRFVAELKYFDMAIDEIAKSLEKKVDDNSWHSDNVIPQYRPLLEILNIWESVDYDYEYSIESNCR